MHCRLVFDCFWYFLKELKEFEFLSNFSVVSLCYCTFTFRTFIGLFRNFWDDISTLCLQYSYFLATLSSKGNEKFREFEDVRNFCLQLQRILRSYNSD